LTRHHASEREIWLVCFKKHTNHPTISYEDSVEEALAFGWIDSIVRRVDDDRYLRKFTPRREGSQWSPTNRRRARRVLNQGGFTQAGLRHVEPWIHKPEPQAHVEPCRREVTTPDWIADALKSHPPAWEHFTRLASSHRRTYILWITSAVREETKRRRLSEAVERLTRGETLGLK